MLYHLFTYLEEAYQFPGAGLFQYISFRAALSVITSLLISMVFGKKIIQWLQLKQVGEIVRDLGLEGQMKKQGTPTMGGIIILASIIIPTLLFTDLTNIYIQTMLIATVWLGLIGFIDDYIKVFKKNKAGLAGKFKVIGQVGVGIIVGSMLYFSDDVMIKEPAVDSAQVEITTGTATWEAAKSTKTTIPFVKNNEFDYVWLIE
jgi:phospho-N-acetylmuramoyl-pentapeptide-transferase